jgi:hypothetical protein
MGGLIALSVMGICGGIGTLESGHVGARQSIMKAPPISRYMCPPAWGPWSGQLVSTFATLF